VKPFKHNSKLEAVVAELLDDLENTEKGKTTQLPNCETWSKDKAKPASCNDGLLALRNDKLELTPPKPGGNWPLIDAEENVIIRVSGVQITGPTFVRGAAEVEIELLHQLPQSKFTVELAPGEANAILETMFIPGKKYCLADQEPQNRLKVQLRFAEPISPEPIDEKLIYQKLTELGVVVDINTEAVRALCNLLKSTQAIIAVGRPVKPTVDGWIQYLFDPDERIVKAVEEEEPMDFFDKGEINSVEEGTVLAVLHPPVPGEPGLTVTGKTILALEPKTVQIRVGAGAKLTENGQAAIATINGRPSLTGKDKVISVVSQIVIPGDVDISTGHIRFKGDVVILGDVTEGLVVEAGGKVHISGSVHHARIYGETGVTINKGVIGGVICAGGEAARYRRVLPELEKLVKSFEAVLRAFEQVKSHPKFSTKDLKEKGDGPLIKLILEMRFPYVAKVLEELQQASPGNENGAQGIWQVFNLMAAKLVGLGPLSIKSIDEVYRFQKFAEKVIGTIRENLDTSAHVTVGFCQNSLMEATGNVLILREGMYHSRVFAGEQIKISGYSRGGELSASTKIIAKELGSATGAQTLAGVDEHGEIRAEYIFPNVTLRFGDVLQKNQDELKWAVLSFNNGLIKENF
jgi:uncharacterized protein (DUF342 family)